VRFRDRTEAGKVLAVLLQEYAGLLNLLVLGLPRGGVPVAYEVAAALHAPLDVFLVRKLGAPSQPELAMGAVASGGTRVLNQDVIDSLAIPAEIVEVVTARERAELERREQLYRGNEARLDIAGRSVIVVDDGLATGSTMRAALTAIRHEHPVHLVAAAPTAAPTVRDALTGDADANVCAMTPEPFAAVGLWYDDFRPVGDDVVYRLLTQSRGFRTS
jgi:putative phosphoribosyl transferase